MHCRSRALIAVTGLLGGSFLRGPKRPSTHPVKFPAEQRRRRPESQLKTGQVDRSISYFRTQIIRAEATSTRGAILVGTPTGLYRTLTATSGAAALWERIGNLPHAFVQDLKYAPPAATHRGGEVLPVGLQGRGTWQLLNASSHL